MDGIEVFWNTGTPKSSNFMEFSIKTRSALGTTIYGTPPYDMIINHD